MNVIEAHRLADYLETLDTYHPDITQDEDLNHTFYMAKFLTVSHDCATTGCIAGSCWIMNGSPTLPGQAHDRQPDSNDISTYAASYLGLTDKQEDTLFTPSVDWLPEGGYDAITSHVAAQVLRRAVLQYEKDGDFDATVWDSAHDDSQGTPSIHG